MFLNDAHLCREKDRIECAHRIGPHDAMICILRDVLRSYAEDHQKLGISGVRNMESMEDRPCAPYRQSGGCASSLITSLFAGSDLGFLCSRSFGTHENRPESRTNERLPRLDELLEVVHLP